MKKGAYSACGQMHQSAPPDFCIILLHLYFIRLYPLSSFTLKIILIGKKWLATNVIFSLLQKYFSQWGNYCNYCHITKPVFIGKGPREL